MRILIANTPLMYRESLAMAIHRHSPDFEMMIADPASMDGEATRFAPHALIRDDDGIELGSPDGVVCWVGIMIDNHLHARISIDGKVSKIHEVSLDELLAALDEAARFVSENGVHYQHTPTAPANGTRGRRIRNSSTADPR